MELRWPQWCRRARGLGVRSVIFAQLPSADGVPVGALVLYSRRPYRFSLDDEVLCDVIRRQTGARVAELRDSTSAGGG
jgi:hypothetical protein